jgi:hypothetical protein
MVTDASAATMRPLQAATFQVPVVSPDSGRLEGVLAKKDFTFRLPEHVRLEPGSEIQLHYRSSEILDPDVSTLTVLLNGQQLGSTRVVSAQPQDQAQVRGANSSSWKLAIPDGLLKTGWNQFSVRCLLQTTQVHCRDVDNPASWLEIDPSSSLSVSFSKIPLSTDFQKFPDSLTEPMLMQLEDFKATGNARSASPVVSILVPLDAGDTELRAFLISAARLGQTLYTPAEAVAVRDVMEFERESAMTNGILIGTKRDLSTVALPAELAASIASLEAGAGFLAETIIGNPATNQRRWIIASGGDSEGLEKAALTLGSSAAMRNAPANPWVITETPTISPLVERLAHPANGAVSLASLYDGGILLRGLFRNSATRQFAFPPGYETAEGSYLDLDFTHASNLEKTSAFEVTLNDRLVGSVDLPPQNSETVKHRMTIPAGIPGLDPSLITVSSYMDIGSVDCAHRAEERAWLNISGESQVQIKTSPLRIEDLSRLNLICLRDAFLRRAAIIVPSEPSLERNDILKIVGLHLGNMLHTMPVLWPEAATYGIGFPAASARVVNRSGLILGSAIGWSDAFSKSPRLAIEESDTGFDSVSIRGEKIRRADVDPTLSFVQMIPSPWSNGEMFAGIGALEDFGGIATVKVLTESETYGRLDGMLAVVDATGRVINYEARLTEQGGRQTRLQQGIFRGAGSFASNEKAAGKAEAGIDGSTLGAWIIAAGVIALGGLIALQRIIARQRREHREKGSL